MNLIVRTEKLLSNEIVVLGEMHVTTPARTMFDLGRHIESPTVAVQRLDALVNATDVKPVDVEAVMAAHPGARYIPRLRRALPLVDGGAESPQETIARLALIDAGLPAPITQFRVFDNYRQFVARLDIAYDEVKVGRIRRPSTLDRPRGATARYRQAIRTERVGLADHPG